MRRTPCLAAVLLGVWTNAALGAASLLAESATVSQSGEAANLCVRLESGGDVVAGTQNDLVWDGFCATLRSEACVGNPATGKDVKTKIQSREDFDLKVLVLSLTDVNPIPDGELYCCSFVVEAGPGQCCPVAVVNALASDPIGNPILLQGNSAQLCVQAGPDGGPPPTPTPAPACDGCDGCHIAAAGSGGDVGRIALALAALLVVVRRRRSRP